MSCAKRENTDLTAVYLEKDLSSFTSGEHNMNQHCNGY